MDEYTVSTDPADLDRDAVYRYLHDEAYWSQGISRETFDRAHPFRIAQVRRLLEDNAWGEAEGVETRTKELLGLFRAATDLIPGYLREAPAPAAAAEVAAPPAPPQG